MEKKLEAKLDEILAAVKSTLPGDIDYRVVLDFRMGAQEVRIRLERRDKRMSHDFGWQWIRQDDHGWPYLMPGVPGTQAVRIEVKG